MYVHIYTYTHENAASTKELDMLDSTSKGASLSMGGCGVFAGVVCLPAEFTDRDWQCQWVNTTLVFKQLTLPETNMAPENGWLEY